MVRTASNGLAAFLGIGFEKARREQETERLDGLAEGAGAARTPEAPGSRPVRRPPPLRLSGFFGSGM